jgi:hypothetical protein
MRAVAAAGPSPKDEEIEAFYSDNSEIVRLLLAVVNAVVFDPAAAGEAYRIYANHFWASVRGERTEGYPNYRKPFSPAAASGAGTLTEGADACHSGCQKCAFCGAPKGGSCYAQNRTRRRASGAHPRGGHADCSGHAHSPASQRVRRPQRRPPRRAIAALLARPLGAATLPNLLARSLGTRPLPLTPAAPGRASRVRSGSRCDPRRARAAPLMARLLVRLAEGGLRAALCPQRGISRHGPTRSTTGRPSLQAFLRS